MLRIVNSIRLPFTRPNIRLCRTLNTNSSPYINLIKGNYPSEDIAIHPDFITEKEEQVLLKFTKKKLKRMQYQESHLDNKISNYKECQVSIIEDEIINNVVNRMKDMYNKIWLPIHILELDKNSCIKPHVDNEQLSGSIIMGLCLNHDTCINFEYLNNRFELLAKRRALYIQKDFIRYHFKHSIDCNNGKYKFNNTEYDADIRTVWLLRDVKTLGKSE